MTLTEKKEKCTQFFNELVLKLNNYEVVESCNHDFSRYLVPVGTADQISYESKPDKSFRISDHWNWYANLKKCPNPHYIQCYSVDLPWAKKRLAEGKASNPVFGVQVAMIGDDGKYHVVYGEKFNRKTKTWEWIETSVDSVEGETYE